MTEFKGDAGLVRGRTKKAAGRETRRPWAFMVEIRGFEPLTS